ncbi:MAG: protein kinase, partial [Planctomycetota bacterium]
VGTLDGRPVVKVLDFSIASALTLDEESTLTLNGLSVGTPRYMSPEQIDPSIGGTSTRTDVFALGVMLHELLVGCHPHIGERHDDTMLFTVLQDMRTALPRLPSAHLKQRTRDRRQGVEGVHWTSSELVNDLDAIVHCALHPKPADRYASARELGNDIERFLTGDPVSARTPTAMQRVRRQVRRHPVFAASAVFATLLVIVTVASTSISAYRLYLSSMREATAHAQTRMALVASAASDGDYALASAQLSSVDPEFRDGTWGVLASLLDQSEHSVLLDEQGIAAIWMGSDAAYVAGRSGSVWWLDLASDRLEPALLASGLGVIDRIWGPGSRSHFVIFTTDGTFETQT